jgi:hypothetical protein
MAGPTERAERAFTAHIAVKARRGRGDAGGRAIPDLPSSPQFSDRRGF